MSSTSAKTKTERLEARIPGHVKAVLARAASLRGQSLTDFVVGSAAEAAHRVIRESVVLALSERDQVAFAKALLTRPAAVRALRTAARRYRAERG